MADECTHLDQIRGVRPNTDGCEECLKIGVDWVHLRLCLPCGHARTYQHCKEKHLHRYLADFDFRYNSPAAFGVADTERTLEAVAGAGGKRLTYRPNDRAEACLK